MIKWLMKSYYLHAWTFSAEPRNSVGNVFLRERNIIVNVLNSFKKLGGVREGVEGVWSQNPHLFFNFCGFHKK